MRGKEIRDRSGDSRKGHHNVRHTLLLSPPTDGDVSERGKGQLILRRFRLPLSECLPGNPPSRATGTGNALYLRQTRPLLPSLPSSEKGAPKHRCSTENEKSAHRPSLPGARSPGPGAPRVPTTVPTAPAARSCPPPPRHLPADSLHQVPLQRWPPTGHRVCYNFNSHKDLRRLAPISPF